MAAASLQGCRRFARVGKSTTGKQGLPDFFCGDREEQRHQDVVDDEVKSQPVAVTATSVIIVRGKPPPFQFYFERMGCDKILIWPIKIVKNLFRCII